MPNTQSWCREHNLNMNINPTSVIVKAASMVLELVLFFKVSSITESNLIKLNSFIKMTIEQVNILHDFKNSMLNVRNYFGGLKLHALLHAASQIKCHGVPTTTDVQMLEEHHKESAVQNYADTSKRITTHLIEMTDNLLERNMFKLLNRRVKLEDAKEFDTNLALNSVYNYQSSSVNPSSTLQSDTSFERVNNLGKSVLNFSQSIQCFEFHGENKKYTLHPFITFKTITALLQSFADDFNDSEGALAINQIVSGNNLIYCIQLEKGIRIRPSSESGMKECIIQANSHYTAERGNDQKTLLYTKRYDSVELFSEPDELDYQQVLCIISIIENNTSRCVDNLVILCKYRVLVDQSHANILPYTEVAYDITRNKLPITICRIEDVNRPLCVIPRMEFLKDQYLPPTYTNITILNEIKMWAINLKYVDRNSWTNYNAEYSIARTANENNSAFLMHESSLHTIMQQRIATNKRADEISDQPNEDSDVEYI